MRILFTGGGTGGHLMPIIAISRELRRLDNSLELYYIGPKDKYNIPLLLRENFKIHTILSGKIRRYFSILNISDILFKLPIGFVQSFFLLLFIRPKLVFSKGGSGSLVVSWAARLLRIPIFLHESDSVMGLSNKKVSKFAKKVFISFEKTECFDLAKTKIAEQNSILGKTILVGNPVRKDLLDGTKKEAQEMETIKKKPVILFLGGSQGAEAINEFVIIVLNDLLKNFEVMHISGPKNYKKTETESKIILNKAPRPLVAGVPVVENDLGKLEKYYHLYSSLDEVELKNAYQASSFVITRAGAGTIFEIAALGKPGILIPLPSSASDHQLKNAYQYAKTGAALVIEQKNLTPNFFWGEINSLLSDPKVLEKMKESALKFSKPLAAEKIAMIIIEYLKVKI